MDYLKNLDFSSDEINHLGGTLPRNVIEKLTGISYDKCFGNNNIGYKE